MRYKGYLKALNELVDDPFKWPIMEAIGCTGSNFPSSDKRTLIEYEWLENDNYHHFKSARVFFIVKEMGNVVHLYYPEFCIAGTLKEKLDKIIDQ
jgi:hypothetical protein